MNYKPVIVVAGEPNSVFLEIFFKAIKLKKYRCPIILIASNDLINLQMKKLKVNFKVNILNLQKLKRQKINNKSINLINVNYTQKNAFQKITNKSNKYIENCFQIAFTLIKKKYTHKLINGPISKRYFLNKRFYGVTEYIADNFSTKKNGMLIYNKKLSVCPVTTHLPLKFVTKHINKKNINEKISLLNSFYMYNFNTKPKIGVLGLNPHCETIDKFDEDEKIIKPLIKSLRQLGHQISGPLSADTIFLEKNRKHYDVILGMYHDQVLTPIKTLFEYDAINITLGLPFIRISPDHGPNEKMLGKNNSNPLSLVKALEFMEKN